MPSVSDTIRLTVGKQIVEIVIVERHELMVGARHARELVADDLVRATAAAERERRCAFRPSEPVHRAQNDARIQSA